MLRAVGLSVEGPVLWGRPVTGGGPGVFIVEMPAPAPKVSIDPNAIREWIGRAPELRLDGKKPTVAELQSRLASFWVADQQVLFIGSAPKGVSVRLAGMYKTPLGERRPQPAGYWLRTLHDLSKCRIWWAPAGDPDLYADMLIDAFTKATGTLPYAVLASPSGLKREHGITGALHDSTPPAKPVKVTRVTKLPDATEDDMALSEGTATRRNPAALPPAKPAPRKPATRAAKKVVQPATGPSAIVPEVKRKSARSEGRGGASSIAPTHVTFEGLAALQNELEDLTTVKRPEVIARIKAARELGDLSENADYEAARKEQSFLEGRVLQLEQMIKYAVIIDTSGEAGTTVVMGSTVVVETDRHGEETFQIVGSAEAMK